MNIIERWAQRRPATRWPAVLLTLLLLAGLAGGITGCGGGDSSSGPEVLATGSSDAQSGHADVGGLLLALALPGPVLELDAPATVRVRIAARLRQQAHYAAVATASLALQQPAPTEASAVAKALVPGAVTTVQVDYAVLLHLPAGRTPLQALLTVRAIDPASGLPTGALARAEAQADWVVERP